MDTQEIQNFIVVAEEGSFSKAAGKLFMTPQGLSKSIKGLEQEVGVELLTRSSKGIALTENGRIFLNAAQELRTMLIRLQQSFKGEIESKKTKLKIMAAPHILVSFMPFFLGALNMFNAHFSDKREVEIVERSDIYVEQEVSMDNTIIGITKLPVDAEEFDIYPLDEVRYCALIYEGHPLYENEYISINDLKDENILIENRDFKVNSQFRSLCLAYGFTPNIVLEAAEAGTTYYLTHERKGIAIIENVPPDKIGYRDVRAVPFREDFSCKRVIITKKGPSNDVSCFLSCMGYNTGPDKTG